MPCFFLGISCHKYNLTPSLIQYIYLISYKIALKASPEKGGSVNLNEKITVKPKDDTAEPIKGKKPTEKPKTAVGMA